MWTNRNIGPDVPKKQWVMGSIASLLIVSNSNAARAAAV